MTWQKKLNIFWVLLILIGLSLSLLSFYRQAQREYERFQAEEQGTEGTNSRDLTKSTKMQLKTLTPFEEVNLTSFWKDSPELFGLRQEKTYLLLFQNSHELRPTGGYIGTFGLVKVKNGRVAKFNLHNTNVFDYLINNQGGTRETPWPFRKYLNVYHLGLRDANWNPDFPTTARNAIEIYRELGGSENLDGVIAFTPQVLEEILAYTGPIKIEGYKQEFNQENVVDRLQYEVEKGFLEKGIDRGHRKEIMQDLGREIIAKVKIWNPLKLPDLMATGQDLLEKKYIQIYSRSPAVQEKLIKAGWAGQIEDHQKDYLFLVDCNLGSLKSDRVVERKISYKVDLNEQRPRAVVEIEYDHKGSERDWRTGDYKDFLRLYVPKGSWLERTEGFDSEVSFMDEQGKTVFGGWLELGLGSKKQLTLEYFLPEKVSLGQYSLLLQKQAGLEEVPFKLEIKDKNQTLKKDFSLKQDVIIKME